MRATYTKTDGSSVVFEDKDPEAVGKAVAVYERALRDGDASSETDAGADPWALFLERVASKPIQLLLLHALKTSGPRQLNQLTDFLLAGSTRDVGGVLGSIRRKTLSCGFTNADAVIAKKGHFYMAGPALAANDLPPVPRTSWEIIRANAEAEEDDA